MKGDESVSGKSRGFGVRRQGSDDTVPRSCERMETDYYEVYGVHRAMCNVVIKNLHSSTNRRCPMSRVSNKTRLELAPSKWG